MESPAATRRTSSVDPASASARPASSRNASRERRQSPVTGVRAADPGVGSLTSWSVPISSYACESPCTSGLERLRTVLMTTP